MFGIPNYIVFTFKHYSYVECGIKLRWILFSLKPSTLNGLKSINIFFQNNAFIIQCIRTYAHKVRIYKYHYHENHKPLQPGLPINGKKFINFKFSRNIIIKYTIMRFSNNIYDFINGEVRKRNF